MKKNSMISAICILSLALTACTGGASVSGNDAPISTVTENLINQESVENVSEDMYYYPAAIKNENVEPERLVHEMAVAEKVVSENVIIPEYELVIKDTPDNEALEFVKNMGIGWNLGNTLDAVVDASEVQGAGLSVETRWCGALTTQEMIDAVKEAGFDTIRIPVTWQNHVSGRNYEIAERWLDRVEEVVQYAYNDDMYIIINIHHDFSTDYIFPDNAHLESSMEFEKCIWLQIAERFKNYDDHLIFESLNEPRLVGTACEWNYISGNSTYEEAQECIIKLNQLFVDTVRATGGNNADRYLMVPGYATTVDSVLADSYSLPTDTVENRLIVTTHAYTPYLFALSNTNAKSEFDESCENEISKMMDNLYDKYVSQGIPVIMGEFGAVDRDNLQDRVNFAAYYVARARENGVMCIWWDNNALSGETFMLLNRNKMTWEYWDIVEAMMRQMD